MKKLVIFVVILLVLLALVAVLFRNQILNFNRPAAKIQQPTISTVKVAYFANDVLEAPFAVAIKQKLFEKYNLNVKITKAVKALNNMLLSKEAEIAIGVPSAFVLAQGKGAGFVWVGTAANNSPFVFVSDKNLDQVKIVGIPRTGGEGHQRSLEILKQNGISTQNIDFQVLGTQEVVAKTLLTKKVDAAAFQKADWLLFKKMNNVPDEFKTIVDTSTDEALAKPDVVIVRKEYLNTNSMEVKNFSKALLEAEFWVKTHSEKEVAAEISGVNGVKAENSLLFAQLAQKALENTTFTPKVEKMTGIVNLLNEIGLKVSNFDMNSFASTQISASLKNEGVLSRYGF